jgi:hypothetical protein
MIAVEPPTANQPSSCRSCCSSIVGNWHRRKGACSLQRSICSKRFMASVFTIRHAVTCALR